MKTIILFALIFSGISAWGQDLFPHGFASHEGYQPVQVQVVRTTTRSSRVVNEGPTVAEGVIPRLLTARDPVQMINPLAPPEYGSGRNFVVFTERDPYRTTSENRIRFQPEGIRLLTLRPLW